MRPFEFAEPATLSEAAALLAERAAEARLLAGGQSLLPMMNAKLVNPGLLVSLGRIPELRQITWEDGGGVRIGAMVTQRTLERSPELRQRCPALAYAASRIASPHVRNLGTLGGNLAHNLAGSDPPAVLRTWRHVKITLKPNNPAFEPIELTADDEDSVYVVAELVQVLS
jgi:carbon-monoxide dehydrogenase medium subunit